MPLAAVSQPGNTPPRVALTISSPDGSAITAVSLIRQDPTGTAATRVQPVAGPSPITVYDYELPIDVAIAYSATITYGTGQTATYSSGTLTHVLTAAWMIHPTAPALSVLFDQQSFSAMGVASIGAVTRPEIKTKHRIQGSEYQVVMKSGPRGAAVTTMQVATTTSAERAALVSLTRDQTPLLILVPAAWGWDWENGYYDVGDVAAERWMQYGPEPRRVFTLPLERVESPVGSQQAVRTFANVAAENATYDAVRAGYATFADLLTNVRR